MSPEQIKSMVAAEVARAVNGVEFDFEVPDSEMARVARQEISVALPAVVKDAVREELSSLLSSSPSSPAARRAIRAAEIAGSPILSRLAPFYFPGEESGTLVCLTSPPSFGKSFAVRKLGESYDLFVEHGCSPDLDEIATLLGSVVPDGDGGFRVFDGVLTQAVRAAGSGKSVLLFLDEIFRLAPRCQEWLLSFLTGVKTPAGLIYRLRTRRVEGADLEVLECPASRLHIVSAGNLGGAMPPEAFWSRWEKVRVEFSKDGAAEIARGIMSSFGVSFPSDSPAIFASAVEVSRRLVKSGLAAYPVDFRILERACRHADRPCWDAVRAKLRESIPQHCSSWDSDSGDSIPASVEAVSSAVLSLF